MLARVRAARFARRRHLTRSQLASIELETRQTPMNSFHNALQPFEIPIKLYNIQYEVFMYK